MHACDRFFHIVLRPKYLLPGILSVIFIISVVFSFSRPYKTAISLWFPDSRISSNSLKAELRFIQFKKDPAKFASSILEELILGPIDSENSPVTTANTRVLGAIASKKTVYIDISDDILFGKPDENNVYSRPELPAMKTIEIIKKNLAWNMPKYNIILTIAGQEPQL